MITKKLSMINGIYYNMLVFFRKHEHVFLETL